MRGPVRPLHIDHEISPCQTSFYKAAVPRFGKRGKKMHKTGMALEQHFIDARCLAKVSVDLKNGKFFIVVPRAVGGKQILQESGVSAAHRRLYKVESFLRLSCAVPEV